MMLKLVRVILMICSIISAGSINAQLFRGSADYTGVSQYEVTGSPDSIFIFFSHNSNKFIEALSPNGDSTTFNWSYYDINTGDYQPLSSIYDTVSRISVTVNQGYRVQINGNGNDYEGRCWTIINDFSVEIYNADTIDWEGETIKAIPQSQKWCHLIRDIRGRIDSANLYYYDPFADTICPMELIYSETRSNWSANPDAPEQGINYFVQNDEYFLEIDIEDPFWEDSWYILTVTDNYGMSSSDSIFNETIEPHAELNYDYIHLDNELYYPDKPERYYDIYGEDYYAEENRNSAPAQFLFRNQSVNADTIIWDFGDSLIEHSQADSILHTYSVPGTYFPKIIVYNVVEHLYETCSDTFPKYEETTNFEYPLEVSESQMPSKVNLPNVFSCPEGVNNYFRFIGDVSITSFEIAIYNRFGKRVYHYEVNIRDWEGWDGKDNNSNKYVHTGVYYYVVKELITMPDFETGLKPRLTAGEVVKKDEPGLYKGFVHVYNTEQ